MRGAFPSVFIKVYFCPFTLYTSLQVILPSVPLILITMLILLTMSITNLITDSWPATIDCKAKSGA